MPSIDEQVRAIRPHVSLSSRQIDRVYRPVLERFRAADPQGDGVARAVRAIRLRRGYIIPFGAAPEDAVHDSEKWTYVVFLCALRAPVGPALTRAESLDWLRDVVPSEALDWLGAQVGGTLVRSLGGESIEGYPIVDLVAQSGGGIDDDSTRDFEHDDASIVPRFLGWILDEIEAERLLLNRRTAVVHKVADGLLVQEKAFVLYEAKTGVRLSLESVMSSPCHVGRSRYGTTLNGHTVRVAGEVFQPADNRFEALPLSTALTSLIRR